MRCLLLYTILISASGLVSAVNVNPDIPVANWQRASARLAVAETNSEPVLTELLGLADSAPADQTINKIEALIKRSDWPLPAREQTLFVFTQELRFRAPFSVPMAVVQYLQTYQPRVLVPHQDHPNSAVPLYPIRAAASGIRTHWTRNQARTDARRLLIEDPTSLVQTYLAAGDSAVVAGIEDSLLGADRVALMDLAALLATLPQYAQQLAVFTGKIAIAAGDTELLLRALGDLPAASQGQILRQAAEYLTPADSAKLLSRIIADAPVATAALAIANLAPVNLKFEALESVLQESLATPGLTTTVALALTRYGSPSAKQNLHALSRSQDNPAMARRIQLVLDMTGSDSVGDQR